MSKYGYELPSKEEWQRFLQFWQDNKEELVEENYFHQVYEIFSLHLEWKDEDEDEDEDEE
jgi:hypothetical protein